MSESAACPLCCPASETVLWQSPQLRVIDAGDERYPGFTRVIWNAHVREMTDLSATQRNALMQVVWRVELAQRAVLAPVKVNLAQFGTMVPHVHWHIIPRWATDPHFPDAVWALPAARSDTQQAAWQAQKQKIQALLPAYHEHLHKQLCQAQARESS
jgi:diadenosine tetraphosphate (Ap4A) HIT family hydrolase